MSYFSKKITLSGHQGAVYCLASNGENVYSAGSDGWIVCWNPNTSPDGKLMAKVQGQVFSLCVLSHAANRMVAGDMHGQLHWIDLNDISSNKDVLAHSKPIYHLLEYGQFVLSLGGDGKLIFWDKNTLTPSETIQISHQALRKGVVSPDGKTLAIAASDGNIYWMDLMNRRLIHTIREAHMPSVFTVAFSPDGKCLYSGGRDAHLKVWDLENSVALQHDIPAHWFTINDLLVLPEHGQLISASRDKNIRVWDLADFSLLQTLSGPKTGAHTHSVNCLIQSPDHQGFISAGDDRNLIHWITND